MAAIAVGMHLSSHHGSRVARPARLPPPGVDDGLTMLAVDVDEVRLAGELTCHGTDFHLDLAEVVVAFAADQLRPGHQRHYLRQVGEHVPGIVHRNANREFVGDPHSLSPLIGVSAELPNSANASRSVVASSGVFANAPRVAGVSGAPSA